MKRVSPAPCLGRARDLAGPNRPAFRHSGPLIVASKTPESSPLFVSRRAAGTLSLPVWAPTLTAPFSVRPPSMPPLQGCASRAPPTRPPTRSAKIVGAAEGSEQQPRHARAGMAAEAAPDMHPQRVGSSLYLGAGGRCGASSERRPGGCPEWCLHKHSCFADSTARCLVVGLHFGAPAFSPSLIPPVSLSFDCTELWGLRAAQPTARVLFPTKLST
jgi:hypothetical protein